MPNHLWPADNFTSTIKTIACPDCIERPGCNLSSPNPETTELCPTCDGYETILHPDEVAKSKRDRAAMETQGRYDLKRRMMGRADRSDLKPWDEEIEGRWRA